MSSKYYRGLFGHGMIISKRPEQWLCMSVVKEERNVKADFPNMVGQGWDLKLVSGVDKLATAAPWSVVSIVVIVEQDLAGELQCDESHSNAEADQAAHACQPSLLAKHLGLGIFMFLGGFIVGVVLAFILFGSYSILFNYEGEIDGGIVRFVKLSGIAQAFLAVGYHWAGFFDCLHICWIAAIFAADLGVCVAIVGIYYGTLIGGMGAGVLWLLCWILSSSSKCNSVFIYALRYMGCVVAVPCALVFGLSGYLLYTSGEFHDFMSETADEPPEATILPSHS